MSIFKYSGQSPRRRHLHKPEKEHRPREYHSGSKNVGIYFDRGEILLGVHDVSGTIISGGVCAISKKKKRIVLRCYRKPYLTQFIIRRTFITELLRSGMESST